MVVTAQYILSNLVATISLFANLLCNQESLTTIWQSKYSIHTYSRLESIFVGDIGEFDGGTVGGGVLDGSCDFEGGILLKKS